MNVVVKRVLRTKFYIYGFIASKSIIDRATYRMLSESCMFYMDVHTNWKYYFHEFNWKWWGEWIGAWNLHSCYIDFLELIVDIY